MVTKIYIGTELDGYQDIYRHRAGRLPRYI